MNHIDSKAYMMRKANSNECEIFFDKEKARQGGWPDLIFEVTLQVSVEKGKTIYKEAILKAVEEILAKSEGQ